jgi:hypothetical protein
LDIRNTLRLWAGGKWPTLSQSRTELTADLLSNQVIVAAMHLANAFVSGNPAERRNVRLARQLLAAFSDVDSRVILAAPHFRRRQLADEVLSNPRTPKVVARCVQWAKPLLLGNSLWGTDVTADSLETYFLNLESLFEQAVLGAAVGSGDCLIQHGSEAPRPIFPSRPKRFLGQPDLVFLRRSKVLLIGDCKYKAFDGFPAHSDVYQLLAHAEAFGSPRAVLVYPSESCHVDLLGSVRSGTEIWIATVRPLNLRQDVMKIVSTLIPESSIGERVAQQGTP